MTIEPKCDRCKTTCGLWWTGSEWWCPGCMWAEVQRLQAIVQKIANIANDPAFDSDAMGWIAGECRKAAEAAKAD